MMRKVKQQHAKVLSAEPNQPPPVKPAEKLFDSDESDDDLQVKVEHFPRKKAYVASDDEDEEPIDQKATAKEKSGGSDDKEDNQASIGLTSKRIH